MAITLNGTTGITAPGTETFGSGTALGGATNPIVSMAQGAAGYVQSYIINNTNGGSSSADIVAYPSNGTDSHGWVDMGITSLTYNDATYTVTGPNESYLFASAPSGSSTTGNLVIATDNTGTANSIQFYTNGFTQAKSAARMTIDSSGNIGIGVTNPSAGASATSGVAFRPGNNDVWFNHASGVGSGTAFAYFAYNSGAIGSITQNGTTGVLYNLTSDYRLKNDQQPLTGAKEFVMALQPKKWQWWDGSGEGVGFIAHEFMEVAKYSGHGEKDAVDENGNIIAQSIQPSSSEVMANLVAFIQEQQSLITQLQADVEALKAK